jgi:DNA primase catalytic core
MHIKNYSEVVASIRLHLRDYLEEQGVNTAKNFPCINPKHNDSTPSCNVIKGDPTSFYCFGCGLSSDIFTAAHFFENKPLVGKEFVLDNLIYLADKYNIEIDATPMTDDEVYRLDTYRIYRFAHDYIIGHTTDVFKEAIEEKGWNKKICAEYGVGTVDDFKSFREHLKGLGFAATFIDDVDLGRNDLFNPNHLIFTIKDELGRPVGFSGRNLQFTDDKKNGPKYNNTSVKCNIYKKNTRLFGIDSVIQKHSKNNIIYIFEGYSDVISAACNGITNCVALSGVNFSPEQLYLLKDYGFYNLCMMLDADETGQQRTLDILENTLSNQRDLKVTIVSLPDGFDPDEFFREEGLSQFKRLKHWTAFEWRLNQFPDEIEPEAICEKMIPIIANETSAVKRDKLEKALSEHTNMVLQSIHKDVERLQNSREMEKQRARENILGKLRQVIDRTPDVAEQALIDAQDNLFELAKSYNEDSFSEERYILDLKLQKDEEEAKDGSFSGFLLGPDLKPLESALSGEWKKDVWGCWGGRENTGKSALMLKMELSMAQIEENNVMCIYHTIDDTKGQLSPRCVCLLEGNHRLTINKVADPNYYIRSGKESADLLKWRERGYDRLITLIKSGRFVMKDANDGFSLSYADRLIRYYKDKYPDKKIVYVLDNFHKLSDFQNGKGDERTRFKQMSTVMKNMATRHHISLQSTVEYPKLAQGQIPTNGNIGETAQVAYDANLICHLYNELHEWGDKAKHYHLGIDGDGDSVRMPRIMVNFGKNKISPYKGRQWYDFYPEQSDFHFVEESVMEEVNSEEEEKKDRSQSIIKNGITEG